MAFKCDNCGSEANIGDRWLIIGDLLLCLPCATEYDREYTDYLLKEGKLDE